MATELETAMAEARLLDLIASKDAGIAQLKDNLADTEQRYENMQADRDLWKAQYEQARAQLSTRSQEVWAEALDAAAAMANARFLVDPLTSPAIHILGLKDRSRASPDIGRGELEIGHE